MTVRVLLDACAVRKSLHDDATTLDAELIRNSRGICSVSLAGSTFAELTEQLIAGRIVFDVWNMKVTELDSLLDPDWPVFPAGKQLAYLTGTQTHEPVDVALEQRYSQAVWHFLRQANSKDYLAKKAVQFLAPDGTVYQGDLTAERLEEEMKGQRDYWANCVRSYQRLTLGTCTAITEDGLIRQMKDDLDADPLSPSDLSEKLDAPIRMIARLFIQSLAKNRAYNPENEKRRGDVFDLDLLFAIPLPAIIVTADERLINRLRGTNAGHQEQVCLIDEFNEHLRQGTLTSLCATASGRNR